MLKNKKFLLTSLLLASFLEAKTLLNGISVIVNNQPITLFEIHTLVKQKNLSTKDALDLLVQKSLKDAEVERLGIRASEYEVSAAIDEIDKRNSMNPYELLKLMKSKGVSEEEYKENIANGIKNKKLFERIFKNKFSEPTKEQLRNYYENNKEKFSQAQTYNVTKYISKTQTGLMRSLQNPMAPNMGVNIENQTLHVRNLDKKTLYFLNQTKVGTFTPMIRTSNGYIAYLVKDKMGTVVLPFKKAKSLAREYMIKSNEKDVIDGYFNKLKADANIEVLRRP